MEARLCSQAQICRVELIALSNGTEKRGEEGQWREALVRQFFNFQVLFIINMHFMLSVLLGSSTYILSLYIKKKLQL